jgi:hypothetical protein
MLEVAAQIVDRMMTQRATSFDGNDDAGLEATLLLQHELGSNSISVAPPDGIKDPSQLATRQDGQQLFAATAEVGWRDAFRLTSNHPVAAGSVAAARPSRNSRPGPSASNLASTGQPNVRDVAAHPGV